MKQRLKDALAELWDKHSAKLIGLVLTLIGAGIGAITNQQARQPNEVQVEVIKEILKEVIREVPKVSDPTDPNSYPSGWVDDQAAVAALVEQHKIPMFGDTDAGAVQELPKAVYVWKFYEKLPIRGPPVKNQGGVGSCVGFGTTAAVERCLAAEIVMGHKPYEWARFAEEVTYANSRVDIGGGGMRGDGSVGAWAAQAVVKLGMVPRAKYGNTDLTSYSEARCRSWGAGGTPKDIKDVGRKYPVKSTAQVRSWSDGQKALANGYSIAVCSNVGFNNRNGTVGTRDSRGVILPNGTWNHCMCIDGYTTDADGKVYVHITNSWGANAHGGPVGWGEPQTDGFWTPATVADGMLRQNDSWTFSGVGGFPRRTLPDGFILNEPVWLNAQKPIGLALRHQSRVHNMDVMLAW